MNQDLRKRVIEDLEKSGFGSEMNAIREFLNKGWKCSGGSSYYDRDELKTREIDVSAYRPIIEKASSFHLSCFYHIVGEVKKSDKPWVLFKASVENRTDAWNNLIFRDNLPLSGDNMVPEISNKSLLTKNGWQAYGIHESFKKPSQPSQWYSASVSVCKASEDVLLAESWDTEENKWDPTETIYFVIVKPVVIIDAILLAAEVESNGSLKVDPVHAAPINFAYRTANYRRSSYSIDVVELKYLDEYLDLAGSRQNDIVNGIKRMVERMKT